MLTDAQLDQFHADGYLVIRGLLSYENDLQPVVAEYDGVLEKLIQKWREKERLTSTYEGLPFGERLISAVLEAKLPYDLDFDISLPQTKLTPETPMHHGPAVFDLLRTPCLLDVVEAFIGPEIYCNPVQHTRVKFPEPLLPEEIRSGLSAQIAPHQDLGVIIDEADQTEMLTVWFPITAATLENGCLGVVPGSHHQGLALHCQSQNPLTLKQVCIPDQYMTEPLVPLPMQPGDVLFMHRCTRHAGLPNQSDKIRWSFDLRYHRIGDPTGRPWFPGFIARSRARPESELHDPNQWAESWQEARRVLSQNENVTFNRWAQDDPRCA